MASNGVVWALHCDEDLDLVGGGFAALGWDDLGDISGLAADREAFKQALAANRPNNKSKTIAQWAGQLYRFVHEASDGDLIVYRETNGGPINVGRLTGPYFHEAGEVYSQRRPVEWVKTGLVPTDYPSGALFELGAFLTWFRIKNHDNVWRDALAGQAPPPVEIEESAEEEVEETPLDADKIDQATKDFLVRRLAKHFKGHPFARLTAHLLDLMGYTTTVSPPGKDYGVDILAHRGVLGLEPPLIKVQVKSSEGSVGSAPVAELLGRLAPSGEAGLFVTLGHYSPDAKKLSVERANLRLIDGSEFVDLLLDNYEQLDDEYTVRFPLRHVYARDLQVETEDAGD